jgi:hypothetical protein
MSAEGRARVRAAALLHKPWEKSTGPHTAEGKARSARNSRPQDGRVCISELQAELASVFALATQMAATRRVLLK